MSSPQTTASDLTAVADAIRENDRFVLTTHENPDGDALGSLLAANLALVQLGKDTVMALHSDAPLPGEYGFMPLGDLQRRWPDDVAERVLLAVDCANESRIADPEVLGRVPLSINVDHHHDNTRFGRINLIVADASSTSS
jgi:phosphoesterase RecJ-like protein